MIKSVPQTSAGLAGVRIKLSGLNIEIRIQTYRKGPGTSDLYGLDENPDYTGPKYVSTLQVMCSHETPCT